MGEGADSALHRARQQMDVALAQAQATDPRDVPVGAVVFDGAGQIVARASNAREVTGDPTAHAEVLAIRSAVTQVRDGWRLADCTLVVTLEPCTMCAGAILNARVGHVIFGAWEPKTGAAGSLWDVLRDRRLNFRPTVRGGVREVECARLLTDFFDHHRT